MPVSPAATSRTRRKPGFPHTNKDDKSPARQQAAEILDWRGTSPRNFKNTLLFLAPDSNRLRDLEQGVRQYLAWNSILKEKEELLLDPFQERQTKTKLETADSTVDDRIGETYYWLIVPDQRDPRGDITWGDLKVSGGKGDSLAVRVVKKIKNESLILQMGGIALRTELERIPLWQGDHVGIKQLSDYFAKHLYLPRLRDEQVLLDAIQEGVASLSWQTDTFAYAEGWNETRGKYEGLRGGNQVRVLLNDRSVVVKPDAAQAQLSRETPTTTAVATARTGPEGSGSSRQTGGGPEPATETEAKPPSGPRRFHGSVPVDPVRLGRDASRIAEEVVQHLTALVGSNVEVTIDIQAELAEPASDKLVRDVTENCRTLRFTDHGFEDS